MTSPEYRGHKRLEVLAAADLGNVFRDDEDGHDYEDHGDGRRRVTSFVTEMLDAGWLRRVGADYRPTELGDQVLARHERPPPTGSSPIAPERKAS